MDISFHFKSIRQLPDYNLLKQPDSSDVFYKNTGELSIDTSLISNESTL